jgi:hypothetical protein
LKAIQKATEATETLPVEKSSLRETIYLADWVKRVFFWRYKLNGASCAQ